ncbi:MAG: DUF3488 and transglutaminase-like domain-containing protein [Phycisphaerales bacterium]
MTGRAFERRMLLVTVLAIVMYALAAQSAVVFTLGLAGIAFGWVVGRSRGSRAPLPMPVVLGLITAVTSLALLRAVVGEGFTVGLFCEFIMMLLVVKMLDRRRARDDAQVLTLSVFLCIGAILTSNNIGVGLSILVVVPILVSAVLGYQLVAAAEAAGQTPEIRRQKLARRDARRIVVVTTVAMFAGSTLMFLLFPRELGERAFGSWREVAGRSQTGYDDEIDLGSTGRISESATPVFDLQVLDRDGNPIGAPGRVFYLRGTALTVYQQTRSDGRWKWQTERQPDSPRRGKERWETVAALSESDPWEVEQRITMRDGGSNSAALFTINEPMFIWFDQTTHWARNTSTYAITRTPSGGLFTDSNFSYAVRSLDRAAAGFPDIDQSETRMPLPDGTEPQPEVVAIAERVLIDAGIDPDPETRPVGDDSAASRAIESFLQAEGGFRYTLSPLPARPGVDPTVDFLTVTKAGHCEYFASAMALMCQAVGIPARVATGYVATEFNDLTGHYVVRRSNAHAWVEVLVAVDTSTRRAGATPSRPHAELWRTYDPTPRNDFQNLHQKPSSWLMSRLKSMAEAIEFAWVSNVVGFSSNSQERALGVSMIASWARQAESRMSTRFSARDNTAVLRAAAVGGLVFGGVLAFGWASSVLARRISAHGLFGWRLPAWLMFRRRARGSALSGLRMPELQMAYDAAIEFVQASKTPGTRAEPLAIRLNRVLAGAAGIPDDLSGAARRLVRVLYAATYARALPDADDRRRLVDDAKALRAWARARR